MSNIDDMAWVVLRRCEGEWRPKSDDIRHLFSLEDSTLTLVKRRCKRIAAMDMGLLWAFDPGPTLNPRFGYFRFAPTHDTNVTRRMIQYNFSHARDALTALDTFAQGVLGMGLIPQAAHDQAVTYLMASRDNIQSASDAITEGMPKENATPRSHDMEGDPGQR